VTISVIGGVVEVGTASKCLTAQQSDVI